MKYSKQSLIEELQGKLYLIRDQLSYTRESSLEDLNYKPTEDTWSTLENLEHLNRYGRFYIPEIKNRIRQSQHSSSDHFKSSWLGNYFAQSMLPKEKLNTMKTFKSMNPAGSTLSIEVVEEFFTQILELQEILSNLQDINLSKVKTSISISKWIKLRLGDTLRVVIYHMERHMKQIRRIIN